MLACLQEQLRVSRWVQGHPDVRDHMMPIRAEDPRCPPRHQEQRHESPQMLSAV